MFKFIKTRLILSICIFK